MSDKDIADAVSAAPWPIVTAIIGLYATMLKFALGRHYRAADEVRQEMGELREKIANVESSISYMKGRMKARWGDDGRDYDSRDY